MVGSGFGFVNLFAGGNPAEWGIHDNALKWAAIYESVNCFLGKTQLGQVLPDFL